MSPSPPILFDRTRLRKRRARAAQSNLVAHDFLLREMAARLTDSMSLFNRHFPRIIELGAHTGQLASDLAARDGTTHYVQCDVSLRMLHHTSGPRVAVDEELLPFAENCADAVVSIGSLHWVNDLPGTLAQIRHILKPDGLLMAILPGGNSLQELRSIFAQTDAALYGGMAARVAPFLDIRDAGALLQRAGFALPVADSETVTITYPHLFALMEDLRGMGEVNMLQQQVQHFSSRRFFAEAATRYSEQYANAEGRIPATVEFLLLTAWKPAANQQQPARRGSGKISLTSALD